MKGLLITISGLPRSLSDFLPDNGLALLASCLIKNNIDVEIFDFNLPSLFDEIYTDDIKKFLRMFAIKVFIEEKKPNFLDVYKLRKVSKLIEENKNRYIKKLKEDILNKVEKERLSFLGFKLWAGDGFEWAIEIGEYIKKKRPDVKIFGGGPQVDIFEQLIFEKGGFFDALCYGEGEETIVELCNFVQGRTNLEQIPNIIFKKDGNIIKTQRKYISNLDSLPFPIYDKEVYWKIDEKIKVIVLDETRGCENACFFCIHPKKSGRRKEKSINKLIEEIKFYKEKYKTNLFRFAGSSTPGEFLKKFAIRIIEEKININYVCSGYVNDYKSIDFDLLKKSGCESIFWGIESANEKILKEGMNKKVKKEDMEEILLKCKKSGIFTVTSFIFPAPFENEETRKETLEFIEKIKPDSALVQFPGIYPGTIWFKFPERFNFEVDKKTYPLKVMNYKIKALFPPTFWLSLPYKVNGMDFKEFARETEKFQKDIRKMGVNTSVSNEDFLFFKFSKFKKVGEFLKFNQLYFYSGDSKSLYEEIEDINKNSKDLV